MRDREAHRASMTISANYIAAEGGARDQINWNPEWSRRARGFALYAALRELGRTGVEQLVDRSCAQARALVTGIGTLTGAEVLWTPHLNQGLVRFRALRPGATEADHDDDGCGDRGGQRNRRGVLQRDHLARQASDARQRGQRRTTETMSTHCCGGGVRVAP